MTAASRGIHCAAVALAIVVWAFPAAGQTTGASSADRPLQFMPRTAFHIMGEHLSGDDPRYVWEANIGGELDVVDYGVGRLTFEGNYQVVLGEEIRSFDPNQGNYILAGRSSVRVGATEVAGVLYHQSRHLADRPKQDAVDWNMMGGRVSRTFVYGDATVDARADLRGVFMKSFVDYSWELDAGARTDVKVHPGVGVIAVVGMRHLGVDGSQNRDGPTGYRVEGGVRLEGPAGAIELFIAIERRIDPYPVEFGAARWVTAGFRLLSRESGR